MDSVLALKDIGVGKDVLIIAGGTSVKNFRFDKLKDVLYFGVNFQFLNLTDYGQYVKLDYQLYTDKAFSDLSINMDFGNTKLIGHKPIRPNDSNLLSKKADYWFNKTIIKTERDSCYYAIEICHDIMNFDNIYIIGLDAYKNWHFHYWLDEFVMNDISYSLQENQKKMIEKVQFKKMLKYYKELKDYKNVYNLNPNSKIKVFPFKDIK